MRVKISARAECRRVNTPSTNGELAESASSSGSQFRSALLTAMARSTPLIAVWTWIPKLLFRQTTYPRISSLRR